MNAEEKARLEAVVAEAQAEVARVREENEKLAEALREDPSNAARDRKRQGGLALVAAREALAAARRALALFEKTGSPYGLVVEEGEVLGTVAVTIKGGASRSEREALVDGELNDRLYAIAGELGAVLAARPTAYTKERPGRDAEGRTVLDVFARIEGDRLMPAVSRAARSGRGSR